MNKIKRFLALLAVFLIPFHSFLQTACFADAPDPAMDCAMSIRYKYGSTPIAGAKFDIYRVADRPDYSEFQLIPPYTSYPVSVNNATQKAWDNAALALAGYVVRDRLTPTRSGTTDSSGTLNFRELKPGLYLIIPTQLVQGNFVYTSSPFFAALPGLNPSSHVWDATTLIEPKCTRTIIEDTGITRRVLKYWDDKGYETIRPKEVTVQLLRDGTVFDTVTLNDDNRWSYTWTKLDASHEWVVVEKEIKHYAVTVTKQGNAFLLTNHYYVPISDHTLVISKKITGDRPATESTFTFLLSAADASCPMPEGSSGRTKELKIRGAGSVEVGGFLFTEPGIYQYTITEKNDGVEGYSYDSTVFTVTFHAVKADGKFTVVRTISSSRKSSETALEFVNTYTEKHTPSSGSGSIPKGSGSKLPQTGLLWWPVPILAGSGLLMCLLGIQLNKRRRY